MVWSVTGRSAIVHRSLVVLTTVLFGVLLYWTFFRAPLEAVMGIVQKIFYLHVPAAIAMQMLYVASGVASILVLWNGSKRADAVAVGAAEIGVVMSVCVLLSGPLWARKAWGHYWEWEPRLTLTLVLTLLFMAYTALRAFGGSDALTRKIAAGIAIAGIPAIYLVRVSVELWRGTHPRVVWTGGLVDPDMRIAFGVGIAAFVGLAGLLVWERIRLELAARALDELALDASARYDLDDE